MGYKNEFPVISKVLEKKLANQWKRIVPIKDLNTPANLVYNKDWISDQWGRYW